MDKDREFIKYLSRYLPTGCREHSGVDYNLKQIHLMIKEYLEEK